MWKYRSGTGAFAEARTVGVGGDGASAGGRVGPSSASRGGVASRTGLASNSTGNGPGSGDRVETTTSRSPAFGSSGAWKIASPPRTSMGTSSPTLQAGAGPWRCWDSDAPAGEARDAIAEPTSATAKPRNDRRPNNQAMPNPSTESLANRQAALPRQAFRSVPPNARLEPIATEIPNPPERENLRIFPRRFGSASARRSVSGWVGRARPGRDPKSGQGNGSERR